MPINEAGAIAGEPDPNEQEMASDEEIIAAKGVTITLCGREFHFPEVGNRMACEMLDDLLAARDIPGILEKNPRAVARSIPIMLDFFFKYNKKMRSQKQYIEDKARPLEISMALRKVHDMLQLPFVVTDEEKATVQDMQ